MLSRNFKFIAVTAFAVGFIGCAGTPPNLEPIASTADPSVEIAHTDDMLKAAKEKQVDVLSPDNFKDAQKNLNKAKEYLADKKSPDKILEKVSYSRAWLNEANAKAELSTRQLSGIQDARQGAMAAKAPEYFPKEWKKLNNQLENVTKDIEGGNLKAADKKGPDIIAGFRQLERDSVSNTYLGKAEENLTAAKKADAEKKTPKTYGMVQMKYNNAEKLIAEDPRNTAAIARAGEEVTADSYMLGEVMNKVNAGNSEDLVLQSMRQQRTISGQQSALNSQNRTLRKTEAELKEAEKSQALIDTAAKIRSQFKPNEAEVFTQDGKVMVRLKGLNFPSGQASLGPKNKAFVKKVETALADIPTSKISVEGHTDSTGSAAVNQRISEQRAKAVSDQLIANGAPADRVDSVGLGDEKPIGSNSTAHGRAQNRRIDLVIEPQLE
ncbi:MAG: OmpA family protein [Bdellovibrio sp.]|nr:OmpA family protein [Bdellovibrio sp.]